jgi:hypothetical protein
MRFARHWYGRAIASALQEVQIAPMQEEWSRELRLVFDGPPGRDRPTLIEIEDHSGRAVEVGEWRARADGYWELVIPIAQR